MEKKYISLNEYLNNVSKVINGNFSNTEWVKCEISNINEVRGNYYIEVIDIDQYGNKTKNQTAIIYKGQVNNTINKFREATNLNLSKGMKVLFKLKVNFTAKFSLSLIVEDIEPNFTLGEMEAKINKIRNQIKNKGFDQLNKNINTPINFTKIAVISPQKAAGLADFLSESEFLSNNELCEFDFFTGTFEGDSAKNSIVEAFKKVNENINNGIEYDALVLIRGGGSKMSLHYLNEYLIAVCVCRIKIPVFAGIGHEIDKVLIDEYANFSFDTPSKVIEYISSTIFNNYQRSIDNINKIDYQIESVLENSKRKTALNIQQVNNQIDKVVLNKKNETNLLVENISNNIIQIVNYLRNKAKEDLLSIENSSLNQIKNKKIEKNNFINKIIDDIEKSLMYKYKDYSGLLKEIKEYSPAKNLGRGYAIIKNDNKIVNSIEKLKKLNRITIILEDGEIELEIKEQK
jgi:exodeoxyribonuclease VII large subunit